MNPSAPNRLLAIGDIHGCFTLLTKLIDRVKPAAGDQVIFLGDYIDRGPDSRKVIDYLIRFQDQFPDTIFLRGNHEQMFLNFLSGEDHLSFLLNGGSATLESYESSSAVKPTIPPTHLNFFSNLQTSFISGDYIFVHAGLRPGVPIRKQEEHDMIWIRGEFINSDYDWGKVVVFGHSPQPEVLVSKNKIGLDTGAVYNGLLTCCDVLTGDLWQTSEDEPEPA